MTRYLKLASCLLALSALAACSDEKPQTSENHVWKAQTDTLNQAQQAADDLNKSLQQQSQQLDSARQ
ncbi:MAG: hypothetical protein PVG66_16450 [Chromatiales bacterium]|jgi:hypothetical protein